MRWLEIIELRTGNFSKQSLEQYLQRLCSELEGDSDRPKFRIYESSDIEGDLSIHLFHSVHRPDSDQSPLSYHIASMLRTFGLVRRSSWIERTASKESTTISNDHE